MKVFSAISGTNFKSQSMQFSNEAMTENNPRWEQAIHREQPISQKTFDLRTPFERDKNRIIYSNGYDRLRYKTQVFFNPTNDMVSTRSTHVNLVTDVARSIARHLGLNEALTESIAQGHDLGHTPFGHDGERSLSKVSQENGLPKFWHEKNSLRMVDDILLLENSQGKYNNLNLTYAVRDGIINHCGEVNQNFIMPRQEFIDLQSITRPAQVEPFTWEGIVVKIADKIAYLGRDIEDAKKIGVLKPKQLQQLQEIMSEHLGETIEPNNTNIVNLLINDVVQNSSPERGIGFSEPALNIMDDIKAFNYKHIYHNPKIKTIDTDQVIGSVFDYYDQNYDEKNIVKSTKRNPVLTTFRNWMVKYVDSPIHPKNCENKILYDSTNYKQAIVDFISGMTDKYILNVRKRIIR